MSTEPDRPRRRYGTIVGHLENDPLTAVELVARLSDGVLVHLGAAIADEARRRAVDSGDEEALIADAFDTGFGRDGMAALPWISGHHVVCPGSLISKNRTSHRCRFVSVDDTWVWDSALLLTETKRSTPGNNDGFRAVALLPVVEGTALDVVTGRMRSGQHRVEHVVSYEIRRGQLIEVSQRSVRTAGLV